MSTHMSIDMFDTYIDSLSIYGSTGVGKDKFELGREGKYSLQYIPFEHVNKNAKLVIVGITPGPNQISLAYGTAQAMINSEKSKLEILKEVKNSASFGSKTMRPNLVKMLNHFEFNRILGIDDINKLWSSQSNLLYSTSVIPHAAFSLKKGKDSPFSGSFDEVMKCELFHKCFLDCFLPSINDINQDAMYVGLGSCPEQALEWCVKNNYIRKDQVLGSMSHPSTQGGSSVGYFLREKRLEDLNSKDPVRYRAEWLDLAYDKLTKSTDILKKLP